MSLSPTQIGELTDRCRQLLTDMQAILRRDVDASAVRMVHGLREILIRYGRPGIAFAVRFWFDAVIDTMPAMVVGEPVGVVFANTQGTETLKFSQVSPEHRWAAYAISARFAGDEAALYRLLEQVPDTNEAAIYLMRAAELACGVLMADLVPGPIKPGLYELGDQPVG